MKNLSSENNLCFVCGDANQSGMKLKFEKKDDNSAFCTVNIPDIYQGYADIIHGGIVSTLLDEAMSKTIHYNGLVAVTAELTVKFKNPVPANTDLILTAKVEEHRRRLILASAQLSNSRGMIYASATAKFFTV